MPTPHITELALRAAVNTTGRVLTGEDNNLTESIKAAAIKRANAQITANSSGAAMEAQQSAQSTAIGLAVAGLGVAFVAVKSQLQVLHSKRLAFDIERQVGIATFLVPTNIEEVSLSLEERVIKGFLELTAKNPSFSAYLGIHSGELLNEHTAKFHSVLPFYKMSEALGQPLASPRPLDRQRTNINLFFKSALPTVIGDIERRFQGDNKLVAFWTSLFKGRNYLNNRRAPRFIMIGLSNLLWNLQHPVDTAVGFPLSLTQCIEFCREVELYLNQFLNAESGYYLGKISNGENNLLGFLRKVEVHTKALRSAYAEEQLHELNIDEVTNSAHRALRIMDNSIFKLIYRRRNPLTKVEEPDDKAAENLAYLISYLNELVKKNGELAKVFNPVPEWISMKEAGINTTPQTIIDMLIIFCHLSSHERESCLESIKKSNMDSAIEFAETMREFDKKYVKPVRKVSKGELYATPMGPKHKGVGRLTARRLVPFLTLVVEDYRVEVDTISTYEYAKSSSQVGDPDIRMLTGKQQVQMINLSAKNGNEYYRWTLAPFVKLSPGTEAEFDKLPKHQYRMTQMSKLLDSVSELVKTYRSLLQHKAFQHFLLKCLRKVREEYSALDKRIEDIQVYLAKDEFMSRSMQEILGPMMRDLNTSLDSFELAAANFERVVSAPDFIDQQRQLLTTKLGAVDQQFKGLFDEESGIAELIDATPNMTVLFAPKAPSLPTLLSSAVIPPSDKVEARKVLGLRKLVDSCHGALSGQSKNGHKGRLLSELLSMIDRKANFTDEQIKHAVMELVRLVASYRETNFFQAAYGQTRSAKVLIAAIKDPSINNTLPLASIIFEKPDLHFHVLTDAEILKRLSELRLSNRWQVSANQIRVVATI